MHDLSFVMQRIAAGDRARLFHAYFGQQGVELSRGWIFRRKTRVSLHPEEIARVKDVLHAALRARPAHSARSQRAHRVCRARGLRTLW
jgi:hypothetical protein